MADPKPDAASAPAEADKEKQLPKLSAKEFAVYNHMAEHMDYFHNSFRRTWTILYRACETSRRPGNISLRQFINMGLGFCRQLEMHHSIEEQHVFPHLATRMPAFKKELELLTQHKQIHKGMDRMEEYLSKCLRGEEELRLAELKVVMDGFGKVLWEHLEQEVKELGAENMRRYWTIEEMRAMPM